MNATTANSGARYTWLGFALGLVSMAALVVAGLIKGNVGMVVMASSTAAALAAAWSATAMAVKKKAAPGA
ncbi:hypothetical protein SAMN04489740_2313 [Arthrobacter alpinus]|uniref:Uncharacterized protein n=1 Tax=Arthrobacter alpinus TaxID=656366 RepID=A0A1H5L5N8_9MICC|nr:hypothetical protein [Arthrobacter alpinus]SEE72290.1 hypothetical protein SAMN04489740_2313 [Arthrobacter alpinus]